MRQLTEEEQRALVNAYVAYGCYELPVDYESKHAQDVRDSGQCANCLGKT